MNVDWEIVIVIPGASELIPIEVGELKSFNVDFFIVNFSANIISNNPA